ncbi:MAG: hypothetical protein Q4G07_01920 [Oscillospiraceae bacterium]|nr:hypothetical protein [Oscillospiraceae bacterium]
MARRRGKNAPAGPKTFSLLPAACGRFYWISMASPSPLSRQSGEWPKTAFAALRAFISTRCETTKNKPYNLSRNIIRFQLFFIAAQ